MSLGNGNPKEGDKGSNFNYELKVLQGLEALASTVEQGGLGGVHGILKSRTGDVLTACVTATAYSLAAPLASRMVFYPFIPARTFTTSNLYTVVAPTATAGAQGRILLYSDLDGLPYSKIYESVTLDYSTLGAKTVTTAQTFKAGKTYWLCHHTDALVSSMYLIQTYTALAIRMRSATNITINQYGIGGIALESAPQIVDSTLLVGGVSTIPAINLTVA